MEILNNPTLLLALNLLFLFAIKVLDNILLTSKTILIQRNKSVLSAISVVVSQLIFYKLIDAVANSDNDLSLYVICIASGVGTYLAIKISNKISKEKLYVNVILSDDKLAMMELRDFLRDNKITNLATDGYTKDWEKTIAVTAYAETKEHSKIIDEYIVNSESKFKRVITKA